MIRQHPLISHPVGRMSAAARWYLAGIAMLALVLVAVHFAMQVYAQEEAKRLVSGWAKQSGISVGSVRYRMLRGALTLIDLHLDSGKVQADIPLLFLQGSLPALSGKRPQATAMEIRGAELQITAAALKALPEGGSEKVPSLLQQFWNVTQHIGIYQTRLNLVPEAGSLFPQKATAIDIVRLESQLSPAARDIEGAAHWLDGELRLTTHAALKKGAVVVADGRLHWSDLKAPAMLGNVLGLAPMPGRLSGELTWNRKREQQNAYSIRGEMDAGELAGDHGAGRLSWSGNVMAGEWQGDVEASAWPLAMFSEQLPRLQRHKLTSGRLDGKLRVSGNMKKWRLDMNKSELRDLRFGQREAAVGWHIGSMHVDNGRLEWPGRKMQAKTVSLKSATAIFDPGDTEASSADWDMEAETITFEKFAPAIHLSAGQLLLPAMEGRGSLMAGGRLQLKLQSAGQNSGSSVETDSEGWKIAGDGMLSAAHDSRFKFDVEAKRASLVRFRPVMPKMIRSQASDISGEVNLKLHILAGSTPWEAAGKAMVADAHLQYAGEQWQAETVSIELEKIGAALPEQLVQQIAVQGWRYRAALSPLGPPEMVADGKKGELSQGNSAEPWHIRKLSLTDGLVTVGNADAIWADHAELHASDLRPNSVAPVEARAELGDGRVAMNGMVMWESEVPILHQAKITVRDTLPFFMNEWLTISGAPKIIRGRLYADISMDRGDGGAYQGMGYLRLQHGVLGPALSRSDPLLSRIGMNSHDVFAMLQKNNRIRLRIPLQGEGSAKEVFGDSLLRSLKTAVDKKGGAVNAGRRADGDLLALVRLHEDDSLSQNERTRLRKALQYLKDNPKAVIELKPQLSISSQEEGQSERIRYTQRLIEGFLTYRGISRSRIFPVWPTEQHRSSGSGNGISVVTIP